MAQHRKMLTLFDDYYDMLSDQVRMAAYKRAIMNAVKKNDIVVDLGAGTGILSFFALQAGAARVYAIEQSGSISLASEVARYNGVQDRIVFIGENSAKAEIPEKADVIISETLGSFAIDENTLSFTMDARDRMLKPGGILIPEKLSLWLVPVESPGIHIKMSFWKDVHGIDYTPAYRELAGRLSVENIVRANFLADPVCFANINLMDMSSPDCKHTISFSFTRRGTVHGLGGWFKALLHGNTAIDTSPSARATHWKQAFFPLKDPVQVIRSDFMNLSMAITPKAELSDNTLIDYDYYCSQKEQEESGDSTANTGRNDPCPCGSGKKFKKCCAPYR